MDKKYPDGLIRKSCINRTLLKETILYVVKHYEKFVDRVELLPSNLKAALLHSLSQMGSLTDGNIQAVLYSRISSLDLSGCKISDKALFQLHSCQYMREIDLSMTEIGAYREEISTQGIVHLSQQCRQLRVVRLLRCINITDEAIVSLAKNCRQLEVLDMGDCKNITDWSLQMLGRYSSSLESLKCSRTSVTDDGIRGLLFGKCSNTLTELHISGCQNLTDEAIGVILANCPKLSIFIFHGCPLLTGRSQLLFEQAQSQAEKPRMKQMTWTIY